MIEGHTYALSRERDTRNDTGRDNKRGQDRTRSTGITKIKLPHTYDFRLLTGINLFLIYGFYPSSQCPPMKLLCSPWVRHSIIPQLFCSPWIRHSIIPQHCTCIQNIKLKKTPFYYAHSTMYIHCVRSKKYKIT